MKDVGSDEENKQQLKITYCRSIDVVPNDVLNEQYLFSTKRYTVSAVLIQY